MSGREGYFLLASAKRTIAKHDRRFEEAQSDLDRARQCLEEDRKHNTAREVSFVRFDCEALAIALGRYYTARERTARGKGDAAKERLHHDNLEGDPCNAQAKAVYECASALLSVLKKMEKNSAPECLPGDRLDALPAATKTSIATNLIQVFVISEFRKKREYEDAAQVPVDNEIARKEVGVLLENTDLISLLKKDGTIEDKGQPLDAEIICSPLMMLYTAVGDLLLGAKNVPVFNNKSDVDRLFDAYQKSVTHYDDWRYKSLREFAVELIGN